MLETLSHLIVSYGPAILVGFASGVLSGMFGIGGGIITTPAIRLLLGGTAMDAVATPLLSVIPGTLTGAYRYIKMHKANVRIGLILGGIGACFSFLGALVADQIGGTVVLIGTSVLIFWAAADTIISLIRTPAQPSDSQAAESAHGLSAQTSPGTSACADSAAPSVGYSWARVIAIGVIAGLYSGFFGLGGGVVIVPLLRRLLSFPTREAVGTSLLAVSILSIPGLITHAALGNVNWTLGLGLVLGVIPGAALGAKITLGTSERATSIGFAILLVAMGAWLAVSEFWGLNV